jgi:hypothetical protein
MIRMREQGSTVDQISSVMPHHSRNAICGRINRMGLSKPRLVLTEEDRIKRRREKQRAAERRRAEKKRKAPRPVVAPTPPRAPAPRPVEEVYVPNPHFQPTRPVRFLDSAFFQCAWILDDNVPIGERMVCADAAKEGSSYCPHHHAICWTKTPQHRQRPDRKNFITTDPRRKPAFISEGV